jgi:hypothetical protein
VILDLKMVKDREYIERNAVDLREIKILLVRLGWEIAVEKCGTL